jgi:methionyl-tRNA formyltransferase
MEGKSSGVLMELYVDHTGESDVQEVAKDATYQSLLKEVSSVGGQLLVDVLRRIRDGTVCQSHDHNANIRTRVSRKIRQASLELQRSQMKQQRSIGQLKQLPKSIVWLEVYPIK